MTAPLGLFGPRRTAALIALAAVWGCSTPSTVVLPAVEVLVASGDEQYGTSGQTLGNPLRVLVRTLLGELAQPGTSVAWEVLSGDASFVGAATSTTDETGSAEIRLRLGSTTGEVVVQATAQTANNPMATFRAFLVDRPELSTVDPSSATPGASITLSGSNFSPDPDQNVVLFSGIRGRVTAASGAELTVTIPACLPERSVSVSVQLGVVASGSVPMSIGPGGTVSSLPVGGFLDVADDAGFTCLGLAGGAEYLTVVYSAGTVGAATHPYTLTGLSASAPLARRAAAVGGPAVPYAPPASAVGSPVDPQGSWDRKLRELEAELAEDGGPRGFLPRSGGTPRSGPLTAPARVVPSVGERRTFQVFNGNGFTEVTAVARLISVEAAIFVDENAPAGGFTPEDLELFADRFDRAIHPGVTESFGSASDLDGNERVVIMFSPQVNALTPRGATGFVGGFFYGVDLLDREGSNGGEIFYALVPDPTGAFSDPRSRQVVMDVAPAILAHEFQHMVHFNERVLRLEAESVEAIWLSEALAQYAEEIVALRYEAAGDAASTALFRSGTRARARRYLAGTDTVSLIISTGQGSLAERGAGFLFITYLQDQIGGDLMGRLTRTTRTGVGNVEAETGRAWEDVLVDWWSAVYLDGSDPGSEALVYPGVDLRALLGNPFPLAPLELGAGDLARSGSLWSSSSAYYIVSPASSGSTSVRVSGEAGAPSSRQAALRMRVIRIS